VRHALSEFNIAYKKYAKIPNSTDKDFFNVWINKDLIDANLHEEGIE
jgi:hypothetical protein